MKSIWMTMAFVMTSGAALLPAHAEDAAPAEAPAEAPASPKSYCWRDSHVRGLGEKPICGEGLERKGGRCYKPCPAGMKRVGFECASVCPEGMRDDGAFCRAAEYGRGVGFAGKKAMAKCEAKHGEGNCEKVALLVYPKCKAGDTTVGLVCRPKQPDCEALGLGARLDLACEKKMAFADREKATCEGDLELSVGRCYPKCRDGYKGLGPVCWGKPPEGWVACGAAAAKDKKTCASKTSAQVLGPASLVVSIATLFIGGGVAVNLGKAVGKGGAKAALKAYKAAEAAKNARALVKAADKAKRSTGKLKQLWNKLKAFYYRSQPKIDELTKKYEEVEPFVKGVKGLKISAFSAKNAHDWLKAGEDPTGEDIARSAMEIAGLVGLVDPTGILSGVLDTAAAFTYPKCSKYFPAAGQ